MPKRMFGCNPQRGHFNNQRKETMSEKQAKAMKKSKSTCRCSEELDIMCQNCVRREAIELAAKKIADEFLGLHGIRLVIESKDRPFNKEANAVSDGGWCRSAIEETLRRHISKIL
jgi:hypothetical protein